MPDEPDELPAADAVVVAPATSHTVSKWAAGITDTFAGGLLRELTGLGAQVASRGLHVAPGPPAPGGPGAGGLVAVTVGRCRAPRPGG